MLVEKISSAIDAKRYLNRLGVDGGGVSILSSKIKQHLFQIKGLHVGAANILKQDALSIGADLAVPRGTVTAQTTHVDAILIATHQQLRELSRKELAQPFGLKELAHQLALYTKAHTPGKTKIMGVINANDDSFYEGSRFTDKAAVEAIEKMIEEGADIIDIGAVSSRPGSASVSEAEELERIRPIIDTLYARKSYEQTVLSVDTFMPAVAAYALEHGFKIVNDITGFSNDELCRLTAQSDATGIIMHMQGTPQTMQHDPDYDNLLSDVTAFFEARLEKAKSFGMKEIVLDVGIGFGKRLEHNLQLITHLEHFLKLGHPMLIGASRKSMIDKIIPTLTEERLPGTLAIHLKAVEHGAEIVRTHDVKAHKQALAVANAIRSI
ncbi:MAG: dihydropteroate synthase [Campylobacterota bacterium]|nr:dihydropteroate synthase [Campylobacterota bacterium]